MSALLSILQSWLVACAKKTLQRERPFVITVSGTVGKSSTKQSVAAVLRASEDPVHVRVSAKNYNNELGVPLTVFGLFAPGRSFFAWMHLLTKATLTSIGLIRTKVQTFVLELGVDRPQDMEKLAACVTPDIVVITALTPDDPRLAPSHTENFSSIDALVQEEAKIVSVLRSQGTLVVNADDPRAFALRHATQAHTLTFGEMEAADVRLMSTQVRMEQGKYGHTPLGLEVAIQVFQQTRTIFIPGVFGRSIAYAVCAGVAVATALDIPLEEVCESFANHFRPLPGRTRIIPGIKFTTLFDDTYNASPVATLSALRDLASLNLAPNQRRIACIGEMRELGKDTELLHREIGVEAAKRQIDLFVACGTLSHAMKAGALENGLPAERIMTFDDAPEAGRFLQKFIQPGDVILAKASEGRSNPRGARMERVIKELMADPQRAGEWLPRQDASWSRYS
jgi:UDP-N-acetylmuramoyl-tripeptide--D-alanyl-D-alanine ligase